MYDCSSGSVVSATCLGNGVCDGPALAGSWDEGCVGTGDAGRVDGGGPSVIVVERRLEAEGVPLMPFLAD